MIPDQNLTDRRALPRGPAAFHALVHAVSPEQHAEYEDATQSECGPCKSRCQEGLIRRKRRGFDSHPSFATTGKSSLQAWGFLMVLAVRLFFLAHPEVCNSPKLCKVHCPGRFYSSIQRCRVFCSSCNAIQAYQSHTGCIRTNYGAQQDEGNEA